MLLCSLFSATAQTDGKKFSFDFYGDTIAFNCNKAWNIKFDDTLSGTTIHSFYDRIEATDYQPIVAALQHYKNIHHPDDWVFYQLIRKTVQSMSPKADNYFRYTLYKWFLLNKTGYDATLNIIDQKLLFYVKSDDDIFDLPSFRVKDTKYICINYHDYGFNIDFEHNALNNVPISISGATGKFSYKLSSLPDFRPDNYIEKDIAFVYNDINYHFKIKLNQEVKKMFTNYPVADYKLYFDEPLSKETYNSLIPQLKKNLKGLTVKEGIDYLMHFTRYAFQYQPDYENFGREKHLSPEQTLLYDRSDCEDRAALFYCLVKEIYNMPMIVLAYPHHLTIAVKFDKPVGQPVIYNGETYTVCEPTPQADDLPIGSISPDLKRMRYEVAYVYDPVKR